MQNFTLKMEAEWCSETSVSYHITLRFQNPVARNMNLSLVFYHFCFHSTAKTFNPEWYRRIKFHFSNNLNSPHKI
jgi:hypothetical protein